MDSERRTRPTIRRTRLLAVILLALCAAMPATSLAWQAVKLEVALKPERLGQGTTIEFGFRITTPAGQAPSPLTGIALSYPAHIGIVSSGIGIASCTATILERLGPEGCPDGSLMGYGNATAEIQVGGEIIQEPASTDVFMAPFQEGNISLLFFVNGETPLSAQLLFPGFLLEAQAPFGGDLAITVPLLESFPNGPFVVLVKLRSTIGPLGITYYNHIHGRFVPYRPSGIVLPHRCPKNGFPFAATFNFADGTKPTAKTVVPCPRHTRPQHRTSA
jgi:hypothetical protein